MTNPMQFPDGFVFGGATAAYQVEGETRTHGKGKVPWDDFLAAQGRFSPDPASDFYNKYPVDIDLCQRFGINGIRVSIAWSRIFPSGTGEINPEGVAFYHELFATCNKAGVIPYVTLDHFDTPEAFYQDGGEGFLTRTTIDAFVEYAKFCFAEFTEVKHWFTFNEIPATAEGSFIVGNWPHGEKYRLDKAFQLMHNMMVAHAKAVVAFHEGGFEGEIGIVQNLEPKYPLDPNNAADCEAARMADVINNRWVLDATFRGHYAADTMEAATKLAHIAGGELDVRDEDIAALTAALPYNDCLGVNTYKCQFLRAAEGENDINHNGTGDKGSSRWFLKGVGESCVREGVPTTDWDWIIYPEGLYDLLLRIKNDYPNYKKIYITDFYEPCAESLVMDINENFAPVAELVHHGDYAKIAECNVVMNASGIGMGSTIGQTPMPVEHIQPGQFYFDACYNPDKTQFLLNAEEKGCQVLNGLGMSLYQGAAQIELWTGEKAPVEAMRKELMDILAESK